MDSHKLFLVVNEEKLIVEAKNWIKIADVLILNKHYELL